MACGTAVDGERAHELQRWVWGHQEAYEFVRSDKARALYRTIVEAMSNTREHAGPGSHWCLRALKQEDERGGRSVQFLFFDVGVGVARSLGCRAGRANGDGLALLKVAVGEGTGCEREVAWHGHSRGKGLTAIKADVEAGLIDEFILASCDAWIDLSRREAGRLPSCYEFPGTLLAWTLQTDEGP